MSTAPYTKPLPRPTPVDRGYWDALKEHRTVVQQCMACGSLQWYPRDMCSTCHSFELSWEGVIPRGTVYTYTTQHQPTGSKFDADAPFTTAVVELSDHPEIRLVGLLECDPGEVRVGLPVEGAYVDATEDISLLIFRPRASEDTKA